MLVATSQGACASMRFVAIHGLGCAASQGWPRVAAALAPAHELAALPLIGADGPTEQPPETWGIAAQAARLAKHVGPDDVLVGHSMGGAIAIRMAQLTPVRELVLIEPHVVLRAGFVVRPTLEIGASPSPEARAAFLRKMAGIPTGEGSYASWIERWDWRVFHAMSGELAQGDAIGTPWVDTLAELGCPVRLLWGAKSADAGEDEHAAALARVGIRRRMVPGSAHFIPSEAPDALADALQGI